ncbi:chemotaxis protein [Vibrio parahaemolyticus]
MSIRRISSLMVLWLVTTLSGCSLLEVKIDSQTVPLTKQELNMRILTREYALQFFAQVEQAADVLQEQYDPNDKVNQSYVLLWKINAEEGLQAAAYQVSPMAALIDTWVFTHQMNQFYATGAGRDIFATDEAKQVSAHLANEVDQLAQSLLKKEVYDKTKLFVADFVKQYPFADLSMIRTPAYRAWLEANQISPEYMRYLAEQMAVELQPLVEDIDQKTEARLSQLGEERQALEDMVARERQEIALIITHEREKFAQDMDRVSQEVVNLAMTKLIELVKSTIVYFILFIAAIFFAPLGLGYVLGKRAAVKTKVKQS